MQCNCCSANVEVHFLACNLCSQNMFIYSKVLSKKMLRELIKTAFNAEKIILPHKFKSIITYWMCNEEHNNSDKSPSSPVAVYFFSTLLPLLLLLLILLTFCHNWRVASVSFFLAPRVYSQSAKKIVDGRRVEFLRGAFRSSRGQIILGPSGGRIIGGRGGDSQAPAFSGILIPGFLQNPGIPGFSGTGLT